MMSKFGDGDFDWTDAVLLVICALLVSALGYTVYQMSNQEPVIITQIVTEIVYVNRTINVPVVEYQIIEVETPIYINNTKIVELPLPPPTPLKNFQTREEFMAWIEEDKTDEIRYTSRWTCMDFAFRTMENAMDDGYRVIFVYWQNYKGEDGASHAVNMAYIVDDAVYICWEPQSDAILWEWVSTQSG